MFGYSDVKLKYKDLWICIGFCMIGFVVYSSLTSSPVTAGFKFSDKFMHVVGYFGLMGWFIQIFQQKKAQYVIAALFIFMGIGLEFLQDWGGVRYFELNDMIANTFGVLIAWSLVKTPFPKLLGWFEMNILKAN